MDASLFTKKGGAYRDVFTAFLRKNDLIPCSEASNLADYFLTDRRPKQPQNKQLIAQYRVYLSLILLKKHPI